MAGFEEQLGRIKDRAELRAWIDALPENVEGIIVVKVNEDDDPNGRAYYRFREEDEREAVLETRRENLSLKKWIEYGEYVTIEIDTEADTARVLTVAEAHGKEG